MQGINSAYKNWNFPKCKNAVYATKLILETDKQHNLHTGKNVADCIAATCKKSNLSDAACKFADESVQALILR